MATIRGYLPAGVPLIKRVAAVAGDDVRAFDGAIIVNGKIVARQRKVGQGVPCRAGMNAGSLSKVNSSF